MIGNSPRRQRRKRALARAWSAQAALEAYEGSPEDEEYERLHDECGAAWTDPNVPWWRHPTATHKVMLPVGIVALVIAAWRLPSTVSRDDALTALLTIGFIALIVAVVLACWRQLGIDADDRKRYRDGSPAKHP